MNNYSSKKNYGSSNDRKYEKNSYGKKSSYGDRNSERSLHDAICDDCGKNCTVPFKPSGNKPIYCSNCFEKHGNGKERSGNYEKSSYSNSSSNSDHNINDKLSEISKKLDKILSSLDKD